MTTETAAPAGTTIENTLVVSQPVSTTMTLRDSVDRALANYFEQLDGVDVKDVYNMVLSEVEAPLLEQTLKFCRNNQTRAAQILGLNRGTLRKKLKQYDLL
jgi:Fis family transcriptional regulator